VKLKRGVSRFWALMYRLGFARRHMPFWRVVVEAKLDRGARDWPKEHDTAVTAVWVWAATIEEAEALASLALQAEGLEALTADAKKSPPAARPRREPMAVARSEIGFVPKLDQEAADARRGART